MSGRAVMRGLFLAMILVLAACSEKRDDTASEKALQLAWNPLIWTHTTGVISRRSDIQVRFATDVAPDYLHTTVPAGLITLDPAVEGALAFAGPRDLVFHPRGELDRGRSYVVRVSPKGLQGVPQNLPAYEFNFSVQSAQFEVNVRGLYSAADDAAGMVLRGTLTSADVEDEHKVEQLVSVTYLGTTVPVTWAHGGNGVTHEFRAEGLQRKQQPQSVVVSWDGAPIAANAKSSRTLVVPARGAFILTQATAFQEQGRRQIVASFSDRLALRQNLKGLVRISSGTFTSRVDGNTLTVYPDAEVEGELTLTLEPGIQNDRGDRLGKQSQQTLTFTTTKPQVRFVGSGVILPDSKTLSVPFEAVSARSVHVAALRIYDDNMGQFLQVNKLDGEEQIARVGRYLWQKTIPLKGAVTGRWSRYDLDVTELMRKYPGGMFRLVLRLTSSDSAYHCEKAAAGEQGHAVSVTEPRSQEDGDESAPSFWDSAEESNNGGSFRWQDRSDACSPAYFAYGEGVSAQRNLLASNLGLLAKRDQRGKLLITATDLRTGVPLAGARLTVRNFQGQSLATATSDANGFANVSVTGTPFVLVGEANGDHSYLKLNAGNALPTSHFDVGGETITRGVKGYLYADRGVWRPGDTIHLVLVLQDKEGTLPANHPVALEFYDPRGRLVQTQADTTPVGGFYRFDLKTADDAPTGDWTAKAILGELDFTRRLKIETVMPNRLKVALDLGDGTPGSGKALKGAVSAQWLSGATAAGLKADVKVTLTPTVTHFNRFTDFVFDDPAREFATKSDAVFEGELDSNGAVHFERNLDLTGAAPGMLSATFTTRVFERGGAFSSNRETTTFAPYGTFVGIRVPKGDVARDMLVTDKEHTVEIATLSADGSPVAARNLEATLYKVDWRWWWDKSGSSLAQYVQNTSTVVIQKGAVATVNGVGSWKFEVKQPEWGRYLLRVCDLDGGHCAGRTIYVDWPSWAGREREQSGTAASVLAITADKSKYTVGETATVQLPESAQGRALVTIENGSGILDARWIEPRPGNTRFTVPLTAAMAPNAYVAVTLIQPHEGKTNDRPIRLYGVVPLEVADPSTHLSPAVRTAAEWKPESRGDIEVSEASGREMTYTIAVVDEGLLSLTNFKTPDLHAYFYRREALGVSTWDLYDDVIGAYGAELERLLSLGGSEATAKVDADQERSRFPPVVRFLGPFHLSRGVTAKHQVSLPRYIGAVRVMVVAGDGGAYGSAEKSVFVRQPLMLLPTMPRVVGPGEEITVPVSVFVSDPAIKSVTLSVAPDSRFEADGAAATQIAFVRPEEKLAVLRLKASNRLGRSHVKFTAVSGANRASSDIYINVRSSAVPVTTARTTAVQPGETWTTNVVPYGLPGTFSASLEVSGIPAIDLENRLGYLVQYPHGCLEQTTSSVFPQLYLPALLKLDEARKNEIERNIRAGIERLGLFQLPNGGFSYWPQQSGGFASGSLEGYALWATTYASHFLIEAEKRGYALPPLMRSNVVRSLKTVADDWSADGSNGGTLDQAYRLYVLALAGQPQVGAMNRLREVPNLPNTERWVLAAAYKLAGLGDVGGSFTAGISPDDAGTRYGGGSVDHTFGSSFRDQAMILQSLADLHRLNESGRLVKSISTKLASEGWYSTQEVAYSLMSIARVAATSDAGSITFERNIDGVSESITSASPVYQAPIGGVTSSGRAVSIHNTSKGVLFVTVASRAVPEVGNEEPHAAGLALDVTYTDERGSPVNIEQLAQGTDLVAHVTVTNGTRVPVDNIALTQVFPAGWEIHNDRLDAEGSTQRPAVDYTDIRDDRVMQYFGLAAGASMRFETRLNAAYRGRFYQPAILAEAMYDAKTSALTRGRWVEVVPATSH